MDTKTEQPAQNSEAKYTQGPWTYAPDLSAIVTIRGGQVLCICDLGKGYIFGEEAEANAARIVQCVNTHDRLVEALNDMVKLYEELQPEGGYQYYYDQAKAALAASEIKP